MERIDCKGVGDNDGFFEVRVVKSSLQIELERQGHTFRGQESLANHESDPQKECYCHRPIRSKE